MIKPKKSLGQNYLIDLNILNLIVDIGLISEKDRIIEIGPGTGNLTRLLLLKNPKKIILIEKEKLLSKNLSNISSNKLHIINEDFLKFNESLFENKEFIVFGNLPYNISSQILIKLIEFQFKNIKFKKLILMFQKEVADRIIAKLNTKDYGRLSIISQWRMDIKKIIDVKPKSFFPVPKVQSSLLLFTPKDKFYPISNLKNLERITQTFFNFRRKMVKKPLNMLFKNAERIANENNINLNDRPQNISPMNFYKLSNEFKNFK